MPYDPLIVQPMREELTSAGFTELRTPEEVDQAVSSSGISLIVVNSVCGCAAGGARPGVKMSLDNAKKPDNLYTVFAGQDLDATLRARDHFKGQPPSSPSIALMKDGELIGFMPRHAIEGSSPDMISSALKRAYDEVCS
ncbi:MAG: BrxA/BrxB family bacilliredoxin [Candidatus Kapaibacteriota bacterium]|jgi:putative YphP/YqiW family bacilliredoxin